MRKPLSSKLKQARQTLEADEKQMARIVRLPLADYQAIEKGARVLPLPSQKTIMRRVERALDICGLK